MNPNRMIWLLAVWVMILGVVGSASLLTRINQERRDMGLLAFDRQVDHTLPPWVTLATTSLGAFRGLAVDAMWYRATRLQEEGHYFEANQLSQWITALQPRFSQVWSFHAWNMAYNISVATHTPQERWDWVNKGISLLRDKGIVYNPTAIRLYRELGWIYFHKIGHFMDEMQWYYKIQLATQWQELLGAPPLGATTQEVIDRFRPVAQAAPSFEQLARDHPQTKEMLIALQELGYQPDETLLRQVGRVWMFQEYIDAYNSGYLQANPAAGRYDPKLAEVLADPRFGGAVEPFVACLRGQVLRNSYHMDPAFMLLLMELYGPLDWRHPASHGCYWSELGVKMSTAPRGVDRPVMETMTEIDLLNTNRQSLHALQQLAWYGKITLEPVSARMDLMPDPRFIPAYDRAMDQAKQRIDSGQFGDVGADSFAMGHENFLLRAMTDHYLYGDMSQARYFYKKVRALYGDRPQNVESGRYRNPLATLVTGQVRQNLEMMANASQFIRAMLFKAFDQGLAQNQMVVFERFARIARVAYRQYQKDKTQDVAAPQGRQSLLPFDQIVAETYLVYMSTPDVPLLTRVRAWANAPLQLQQRVYPRLQTSLFAQARAAGLVPEKAFPEPPAAGQDAPASGEPSEEIPMQIERR